MSSYEVGLLEKKEHLSDGFGAAPADLLAAEPPKPEKPSFQTWIVVMRIVLSFMLVLYHNHRIFDSYRHNMNIEPFDWEDAAWVRSLIKNVQRATLQAGLNIFMLISGLTAYYSFRKRRSDLLAQLRQRTVKLLIGYCVGIILVIIPSRFFLRFCGHPVTLEHLLAFLSPSAMVEHFLDGQHIGYLPYLFVLSQMYAPVNVCAFNIAETSGQQSDTGHPRSVNVPLWWTLCGVIFCAMAFYLSPLLISVTAIILLVYCGLFGAVRLWKRVAMAAYRPVRNGKHIFPQVYAWLLPMVWAVFFKLHPGFEFPPGSMFLTQILPLVVCCLNVSSVKPFPKAMPFISLNVPLCALILAGAGQVWLCCSPEWVPQLGLDYVVGGIIDARSLAKLLMMFLSHSSFFYLGFYLLIFRHRMPRLPAESDLLKSVVCVLVIILVPLIMQPSKEFFFITAGYATYHSRWRRVCYHMGSWFWVTCLLLGLMNVLPGDSLKGNSIEKRIVRFLADTTFGVFLCHPMMGFFLGCLLQEVEIALHWKVLLLDVGSYVLSYAWAYAILFIPAIRAIVGVKWDD